MNNVEVGKALIALYAVYRKHYQKNEYYEEAISRAIAAVHKTEEA